jgi:hypothetical protein
MGARRCRTRLSRHRPRIDIGNDLRPLTLTKKKDDEKARAEQLRTATVAALGHLVSMWCSSSWSCARRRLGPP